VADIRLDAKAMELTRAAFQARDEYERACDNLLQKRLTLRQLAGISDDLAEATHKLCAYLLTHAPLTNQLTDR
jgi:hypothetical protein